MSRAGGTRAGSIGGQAATVARRRTGARFARPLPSGRAHLDALARPLAELYGETGRLERWGRELAAVLSGGGRLLAVGNGGSACQAQHLTSELVGRYRDD